MSPNKQVVGDMIDRLDRQGMLYCLADDTEQVDGSPNSGVPIRGDHSEYGSPCRCDYAILNHVDDNVVATESIGRSFIQE